MTDLPNTVFVIIACESVILDGSQETFEDVMAVALTREAAERYIAKHRESGKLYVYNYKLYIFECPLLVD